MTGTTTAFRWRGTRWTERPDKGSRSGRTAARGTRRAAWRRIRIRGRSTTSGCVRFRRTGRELGGGLDRDLVRDQHDGHEHDHSASHLQRRNGRPERDLEEHRGQHHSQLGSDGRHGYEWMIHEAYDDSANPCGGTTFDTVPAANKGNRFSVAVSELSEGNVRGLCVRTDDEDSRSLSFAWGIVTPTAATAAPSAGVTLNDDDTAASALTWPDLTLVEGFNWDARLVADSQRRPQYDTVQESIQTGKGVQAACGAGRLVDSGDTDVSYQCCARERRNCSHHAERLDRRERSSEQGPTAVPGTEVGVRIVGEDRGAELTVDSGVASLESGPPPISLGDPPRSLVPGGRGAQATPSPSRAGSRVLTPEAQPDLGLPSGGDDGMAWRGRRGHLAIGRGAGEGRRERSDRSPAPAPRPREEDRRAAGPDHEEEDASGSPLMNCACLGSTMISTTTANGLHW